MMPSTSSRLRGGLHVSQYEPVCQHLIYVYIYIYVFIYLYIQQANVQDAGDAADAAAEEAARTADKKVSYDATVLYAKI